MRVTLLQALLATLALTFALDAPAQAQNPYAVARYVNGSVITNYDISQRRRLLTALGASGADATAQALEMLTEDAVKLDLAKSLGVSVPEDTYNESFKRYAEQRQMSEGALKSRLSGAGVDDTGFEKFLKTSVMWREIVRERFRARATPSETELQNIMNIAAGATSESVFIRELAIPFAERGVEGARNLANRIKRDVANGASFADMARQYSRTPSAPKGGAIGWTPADRLPPAIASRVLTLTPGQVGDPLEVPAGVLLFQLADIREEERESQSDVMASYVRLDVPIGTDEPAALAQAQALRQDLSGCADAEARAAEFGPESGRFGPFSPAEIPRDLGLTIANLDAGEIGLAQNRPDVISVLVLCARAVAMDPEQTEALRLQIFNQRLSRFADDYLQELLADAIIKDK